MTKQVKSWIREQLEKNWYFKGWFIRRDYRRKMKLLDAEFNPAIEKAKAAKDSNELAGLDAAYHEQWEDISEDWNDWENGDLMRRAHKHLVHVADRSEAPDFWQEGKYSHPDYPDWELSYKGLEKLKRDVRDAERDWNDEWRKWLTLCFALLGTALAVWSLRIKTKQPDPCQKNYFRNDAGECVFALKPEKSPEVPALSPVVIPPTIPQTVPPTQVPPGASTTPPSSTQKKAKE